MAGRANGGPASASNSDLPPGHHRSRLPASGRQAHYFPEARLRARGAPHSLVGLPGDFRRKFSEAALEFLDTPHIRCIYDSYMEAPMGIVNIEDDLHDQVRRASKVSFRSINAQAAWWIKVGMLCETNPTLGFAEIIARELGSAGFSPQPLVVVEHDEAA